jgi:hypothetical protein
MVPLIIRFPSYFTWRPDFRVLPTIQPLQGPPIDYNQVPIDYQKNGQTTVPLLLPRMRSHSTGSVSIIITVPNQPEFLNLNFQVTAQLFSPLLKSLQASSSGPETTNSLLFSPQPTPPPSGFCSDSVSRRINGIARPASSDPASDCLGDIAQVGFDALGFVPGLTCAGQVGLFVGQVGVAYGTSGGDGVGTFTGALAGAYSTAVGCALGGGSPIGNIVNAVQTGIDIAGAINDCSQAGDTFNGRTVGSSDPNDKLGSNGVGTARYLNADAALPYIIDFENKATATAPAQEVVVTDQLDVSKFDLNTFSFGDVTIGKMRLSPLPNKNTLNKDVDLRPTNNIIARIAAALDTQTGIITWRFQSIDPATGLPTDDPLAGFLPPNTAPPQGEGSVMFTIKPKVGLATGTEIRNKARIVFDTNPAIDTPEWFNTLDITKPTSLVTPLAPKEPSSFAVNWSGTDTGSGTGSYSIYVSDNNSLFAPFLINTPATSGTFTGEIGHTYRFYSIARDAAGNEEPVKNSAEATTIVVPAVSVSGRVTTPDGRGLRNATVSIIDPSGAKVTATTSSFGFYSFPNVAQGQQYVVQVSSRLYRFSQRVVQVADTLNNVDFVGLE